MRSYEANRQGVAGGVGAFQSDDSVKARRGAISLAADVLTSDMQREMYMGWVGNTWGKDRKRKAWMKECEKYD